MAPRDNLSNNPQVNSSPGQTMNSSDRMREKRWSELVKMLKRGEITENQFIQMAHSTEGSHEDKNYQTRIKECFGQCKEQNACD